MSNSFVRGSRGSAERSRPILSGDISAQLVDPNQIPLPIQLEMSLDDISMLYANGSAPRSLMDESVVDLRHVRFHHFALTNKWHERDSHSDHVAACLKLVQTGPFSLLSIVDMSHARLLVENTYTVWLRLKWYGVFPSGHVLFDGLPGIHGPQDVQKCSAEEVVDMTAKLWAAAREFTGDGKRPSRQFVENMRVAHVNRPQDIHVREYMFMMNERARPRQTGECMRLLDERIRHVHLCSEDRLTSPGFEPILFFIATVGLGVPEDECPEETEALVDLISQRARATFSLSTAEVLAVKSVKDMMDIFITSNAGSYFPLQKRQTLSFIRIRVLAYFFYAGERTPLLIRSFLKPEHLNDVVTDIQQLFEPQGLLPRDSHGHHAHLDLASPTGGARRLPCDVPGCAPIDALPGPVTAELRLLDVFKPIGGRAPALLTSAPWQSAEETVRVLFPSQLTVPNAQASQRGQAVAASTSARSLRSTSVSHQAAGAAPGVALGAPDDSSDEESDRDGDPFRSGLEERNDSATDEDENGENLSDDDLGGDDGVFFDHVSVDDDYQQELEQSPAERVVYLQQEIQHLDDEVRRCEKMIDTLTVSANGEGRKGHRANMSLVGDAVRRLAKTREEREVLLQQRQDAAGELAVTLASLPDALQSPHTSSSRAGSSGSSSTPSGLRSLKLSKRRAQGASTRDRKRKDTGRKRKASKARATSSVADGVHSGSEEETAHPKKKKKGKKNKGNSDSSSSATSSLSAPDRSSNAFAVVSGNGLASTVSVPPQGMSLSGSDFSSQDQFNLPTFHTNNVASAPSQPTYDHAVQSSGQRPINSAPLPLHQAHHAHQVHLPDSTLAFNQSSAAAISSQSSTVSSSQQSYPFSFTQTNASIQQPPSTFNIDPAVNSLFRHQLPPSQAVGSSVPSRGANELVAPSRGTSQPPALRRADNELVAPSRSSLPSVPSETPALAGVLKLMYLCLGPNSDARVTPPHTPLAKIFRGEYDLMDRRPLKDETMLVILTPDFPRDLPVAAYPDGWELLATPSLEHSFFRVLEDVGDDGVVRAVRVFLAHHGHEEGVNDNRSSISAWPTPFVEECIMHMKEPFFVAPNAEGLRAYNRVRRSDHPLVPLAASSHVPPRLDLSGLRSSPSSNPPTAQPNFVSGQFSAPGPSVSPSMSTSGGSSASYVPPSWMGPPVSDVSSTGISPTLPLSQLFAGAPQSSGAHFPYGLSPILENGVDMRKVSCAQSHRMVDGVSTANSTGYSSGAVIGVASNQTHFIMTRDSSPLRHLWSQYFATCLFIGESGHLSGLHFESASLLESLQRLWAVRFPHDADTRFGEWDVFAAGDGAAIQSALFLKFAPVSVQQNPGSTYVKFDWFLDRDPHGERRTIEKVHHLQSAMENLNRFLRVTLGWDWPLRGLLEDFSARIFDLAPIGLLLQEFYLAFAFLSDQTRGPQKLLEDPNTFQSNFLAQLDCIKHKIWYGNVLTLYQLKHGFESPHSVRRVPSGSSSKSSSAAMHICFKDFSHHYDHALPKCAASSCPYKHYSKHFTKRELRTAIDSARGDHPSAMLDNLLQAISADDNFASGAGTLDICARSSGLKRRFGRVVSGGELQGLATGVRVADITASCPVVGASDGAISSFERGTSAGALPRPGAPVTPGSPLVGDNSWDPGLDFVDDGWDEGQHLEAGEDNSPAASHMTSPPQIATSGVFSPQEVLAIDNAVEVMQRFMPSLRRRNADPAHRVVGLSAESVRA
eukprot:gene27674-34430_t